MIRHLRRLHPAVAGFGLATLIGIPLYFYAVNYLNEREPTANRMCREAGGAYLIEIRGGWDCVNAYGTRIRELGITEVSNEYEVDKRKAIILKGKFNNEFKPVQ